MNTLILFDTPSVIPNDNKENLEKWSELIRKGGLVWE